MFKRYMIVLTVLACLTAAYAFLNLSANTSQENKLMAIYSECDAIKENTAEHYQKCSITNPVSDVGMTLDRETATMNLFWDFAKYTGYILLLMLVSGVLRWIWNGRKINAMTY